MPEGDREEGDTHDFVRQKERVTMALTQGAYHYKNIRR